MTVAEALQRARGALSASRDTAAVEARLLVAEAAGRPTAWVLAHPEALLEERRVEWLEEALGRCAGGEPLPYVLGWWEFYGRRFRVTPDVLIPRPETETLVEHTLSRLRPSPQPLRFLDVGTGSGCLAVTLVAETPTAHALGVDTSGPAVRLARANAAAHGVGDRVDWVQGDLVSAVGGRWDVIVANLPYIPRHRLAQLEVARHEPILALDGGEDGLQVVRRLILALPRVLRSGGFAAFEIDEGQAETLVPLAEREIPGAKVDVHDDFWGRERFLTVVL
jgi:release factor glutamine methyltransferase